ncbi:hypothetical protein EON65_13620 [archaeon]|nr:MAG: hypothetical protein EON65_13620 [archaeon]
MLPTLWVLILSVWVSYVAGESFVHSTLRLRHQILYRYLAHSRPEVTSCPTDRFVVITEYQFGRTGNLMIEFTNTLWVSEKLNATLIMPPYMPAILSGFDTHLLSSRFCFRTSDSDIPKSAKIIPVESEMSYFIFRLYQLSEFRTHFPPMTQAVQELSSYFLSVYAGFWCCPQKSILLAAQYVIMSNLGGSFEYVSVHKRMLEGGCSKLLAYVTKPSDYSPSHIPTDHALWQGNLYRNHPMCDMPYEFVQSIMQSHNKNKSSLYVAHDGQGDVSAFKQHQAVFVNAVDDSPYKAADRKLVDMLISMHGDLFIQNPRSTYSWQIVLVRLLLALHSVPIIRNNDFYLQKVPEDLEKEKRVLWVSYYSAMEVLIGSQHAASS